MSKKISEYFKVTPKPQNSAEILESNKLNFKSNENSINIRNCQIIIKDIGDQLPKNIQIFEEISLNNIQNNGTKLIKIGERKCKFCGKELSTQSILNVHMKYVHSDELNNVLSCLICNKKFFNQQFLNNHLKKKHPDGQIKLFECDFDGKVFKTKGLLYNHMKGHLPFVECEICQKVLKPICVYSHMISVHATDRNFHCKICFKSFKSDLSLKNHIKIHNKKFECKICKKMFARNGSLKFHTRFYHDNEEIFKCETCGKEFNLKSKLKIHQKIHVNNRPKPYKCQQCDYSTDMKNHFDRHQKFHKNQEKKFAAMKNPLKCEKCPTFHRNKKFLKHHMNAVHPEVLFQCDLCAKFSKTKQNLIKHLKLHIKNFAEV